MNHTFDLFINEDLSKPENRVNVALFGMLQQDWFRKWFLNQLNLKTDATVYPSKGCNNIRPDLKVTHDDSTLAWLEVELGKDEEQIADYKCKLDAEVKAIWGRRTDGGDFSLEEIADYLEAQVSHPPQTAVYIEHLYKLIQVGLEGHTRSSKRARLSDEMRDHCLVIGLKERLQDRLMFEYGNEPPQVGYLKADTTASPNNRGFSLGVYSPVAKKSRTLKVISLTAGRPRVYFPSLLKLQRYLPDHYVEIESYASLLARMGLNIGRFGEAQRPSLPLDAVLEELDTLAECLREIADHPRATLDSELGI